VQLPSVPGCTWCLATTLEGFTLLHQALPGKVRQ